MKSDTQKTKLNYSLRLALVLFTILLSISAAQAGTLTVNSNDDPPTAQCDEFLTLREAMLIAKGLNALGRPLTTGERNQIGGATFIGAAAPIGCPTMQNYWSVSSGVGAQITDNIGFANNVSAVSLTSGLPNITWAEDIINGLKPDGTKAKIDGTVAGGVPGLRIMVTIGFTIRNLVIQNFQHEGILVEGSSNGHYEGLEIHNNGLDGILFTTFTDINSTYNSRSNVVGGTQTSQRNFIFSNGKAGIAISASPTSDRDGDQGNIIENNYIGLKDNNGNQDNGNTLDGIFLDHAWGNVIGGATAASRNVISGNNRNGILIRGTGGYSNRIVNNFVGTNKDGNAVIGNSSIGVYLTEGAGYRGFGTNPNRIGDVGQGNVIAGNYFGIAVYGPYTTGNIIRGNFIGTDLTGSFNLGNIGDGIAMGEDAHDNTIGGAGAGEGNIIAFNTYTGIFMDNGFNNSIRGNRIFLNAGGLGIDLGTNGVTLNDFNDTDFGANNLQNYPLISGSSSGAGMTSFSGSINSTANTTLTLDFFVGPTGDPSGYGEGSTYLGSTTVTTNNIGNAGFSSSFVGVGFQGFYATATATDPNGNTSEFSPATRIGCGYNTSSSSQNFGVAGGSGSFNVTAGAACEWQAVRSDNWITITGGASGSGNGAVSFSVAANSGPERTGTITVGGRIFTITQATSCTYQLSHSSAGYPASGINSDGVSLTAGSGCTWMANSNASWITITSGSSGSGNGITTWSVAANTGPARQGTVTVAGQTFTINQASGCTYQLSHSAAGYPASGINSDGVSVTAGSGCTWMANSNASWITITSGSSGSGSGVTTWSVAANTGPARQSTVSVAGQTFTINQAASSIIRRAPFDFDGDGKTDISIFRPSSGEWWYLKSSTGIDAATKFGDSSDKLTPGDFTGDGKTDIAFWKPSTGFWFVLRSEDFSYYSFPFGSTGDIPAPADYDGDGKTDAAVFRPSERNWYISRSTGGNTVTLFGKSTDLPAVADYDGDGKADIAVFRPNGGTGAEWWVLRSSNGSSFAVQFGSNTDKAVQGDYTGDGKADIAYWQPSTGFWYVLRSEDFSYYSFPFGNSTDLPAPGDYDGDGKFDAAIFRPSETNWYISRSTAGLLIRLFGAAGDKPVPSAFIP